MKFDHNKGKTPQFSDVFNQLAYKAVFDEKAFYDIAEKAGYAEARVGGGYYQSRNIAPRCIVAQVTESGKLRRYIVASG